MINAIISFLKLLLTFIAGLAITLSVNSSAYPASSELRIVDKLGLTRAVKPVQGAAKVIVQARSKSSPLPPLSLSNADGIVADVQALPSPDGTYTFLGITSGTWRLNATQDVAVVRVSVVE